MRGIATDSFVIAGPMPPERLPDNRESGARNKLISARAPPLRANEKHPMKTLKKARRKGGARTYALLWLIGIPAPLLLLVFLMRGCQ